MEGENDKQNNTPINNIQRPENYQPMNYAPVKKIDTEEKLASLEQTQLQHAYAYWVKVQEQNIHKKKANDKFEDELKEIDTVSTVSAKYLQILMF